MNTATLEKPKQQKRSQGLDVPITFLHSEGFNQIDVIDQPHSDFVSENDTLNPMSQDSDTI